MSSANDVADCLLTLALTEDPEPDPLTPMRLQKLLYYCQGWWLGLKSDVFFSEPLEAWAHGPVVRAVYQRFTQFGNNAIPPSAVRDFKLTLEERDHVAKIWETYKGFSATRLRQMSHDEPPWLEARKDAGVKDGEPCQETIRLATMVAHFGKLAEATRT